MKSLNIIFKAFLVIASLLTGISLPAMKKRPIEQPEQQETAIVKRPKLEKQAAATQQVRFEDLPTEVKENIAMQNILPLIKPANGILNLPALAKELQNLARVNLEMRAIVNDEKFMFKILKSLPKAGAVYVAKGLANIPGIKNDAVQKWLNNIKLVKGKELYDTLYAALNDTLNPNDYVKVFKILEDPDIDVNWKNDEGKTPLMLATLYGKIEIVRLLIKAGANVNAKNKDGSTALKWTVSNNYNEIAKLLIAAGANVNEQDDQGNTILIWAARCDCTEIVKLLIANGAKVNVKDDIGSTPLMYANFFKNIEMINLLHDAGAK